MPVLWYATRAEEGGHVMRAKRRLNGGIVGCVTWVCVNAVMAQTTFTNNNQNWNVTANWDNGLPGVGKAGIIGGGGSPITARANTDLAGPPDHIYVRPNGTLQLTASLAAQNNIVMEGGALTTANNYGLPAANTLFLRYDSYVACITSNNSLTISSVITNYGAEAGRLMATNTVGFVQLNGANNSYSGGTVVGCTLKVGTDNCLGSGDTVLLPGSTLSCIANQGQKSRIVVTNATISWSAGYTLTSSNYVSGTLVLDTANQSPILRGLIADADGATGRVLKTGSGTLGFYTTNNTYSGGTLVTQGVAKVMVEKALGNGPVTVTNGAELFTWAVTNVTAPGWNIDVYSNSTARLYSIFNAYTTNIIVHNGGKIYPNTAGNYDSYDRLQIEGQVTLFADPGGSSHYWCGGFRDGAAPGTLICSGPAGSFSFPILLSGTNTYTGGTEIRNSCWTQLQTRNGYSPNLPDTGMIVVHTNCVMDFNGFNDTVGGLGGAGLVSLGSAVVTNSEGISPGTNLLTVGTLTVTGTTGRIVLGANSTNLFHLIAPGNADQVVVTTSNTPAPVLLSMGGTLKVDKAGSTPIESGAYTLFHLVGGSPTNSFANLVMPDGYAGVITSSSNDIILTVVRRSQGAVLMVQ